jgi:hypothetical protein
MFRASGKMEQKANTGRKVIGRRIIKSKTAAPDNNLKESNYGR